MKHEIFTKLFVNASGTTAIEYALIAMSVAMAVFGAVKALGLKLPAPFETVSNALP